MRRFSPKETPYAYVGYGPHGEKLIEVVKDFDIEPAPVIKVCGISLQGSQK